MHFHVTVCSARCSLSNHCHGDCLHHRLPCPPWSSSQAHHACPDVLLRHDTYRPHPESLQSGHERGRLGHTHDPYCSLPGCYQYDYHCHCHHLHHAYLLGRHHTTRRRLLLPAGEAIDPLHKSHNTPVPCLTTHHFVIQWCIVGYLSNALWALRDGCIQPTVKRSRSSPSEPFTMKLWYYGNASCIIILMWGESIGHRWILLTKGQQCEVSIFVISLNKLTKQTVESFQKPCMALMWRQWNVIQIRCHAT